MAKWKKTSYPGVRFREHPTRKHGVQPDRYFTIRYWLGGKQREEGLGWGSHGWTSQKANKTLADLKHAQKTGKQIQTLSDKRKAKKLADKARELHDITFNKLFKTHYLPYIKELESTEF